MTQIQSQPKSADQGKITKCLIISSDHAVLKTESKFDVVTCVFLNPQESYPGWNSSHCKLRAQWLWVLPGSRVPAEGSQGSSIPARGLVLRGQELHPNPLRLSAAQSWVYLSLEVWALWRSGQAFNVIISHLHVIMESTRLEETFKIVKPNLALPL